MWHHVAVNSCNPREQLKAYQNSIDVLQVFSYYFFLHQVSHPPLIFLFHLSSYYSYFPFILSITFLFPLHFFSSISVSFPKFSSTITVFMQENKSDWQKVDFLFEFGEWLFVNEFSVQDAVDQVS